MERVEETDRKPTAREEGAKKEAESQDESDASRLSLLRKHQLRFCDAFDPNAERVEMIGRYDVIFGRGKGYQNHPGNVRMREVIEKYKVRYHSLSRKEKRDLLRLVYNEIVEDGASFLRRLDGDDAWVKVDADLALQKVSHTLRCRKSVMDKNAKKIGIALSRGRGATQSSISLHDNVQSDNLRLGMLSNSFVAEAMSPLATLERHRAISSTSMFRNYPPLASNIDYYNMAREDQLRRETMMLQQMGNAISINSAPLPTVTLPNRTLENSVDLVRHRSLPTASATEEGAGDAHLAKVPK